MSEGSLEAPTRHRIAWQDPDFLDPEKLDAELRRVFDICHGCRRCFNLCDSFPRLFDLVDESDLGEVETVNSIDFKPVIDACTLCDMCFMVKCPYVPPHEFNLDFPHLMLRARAAQFARGEISTIEQQLTKTDRNGALACLVSPLANWATKCGNSLTRPAMQAITGVHKDAALPAFNAKTLTKMATAEKPVIDTTAPAFGRKAVIYATCTGEFNNAEIGLAARAVLARNGVDVEIVYPGCCGMPQLEHGDLASVADSAARVASELCGWIAKGYDVVSLVASCSLMLKFEWPLLVADNQDVQNLAKATFDISEYIVDISAKEGLAPGMTALDGNVTVHISCHSRAQNMGRKGADMLKNIPGTAIEVIERCSGHGGSWGVMKDNFDVALKVGLPVAARAVKVPTPYLVSECPLARDHIVQGMERLGGDIQPANTHHHPIQLMALAYGI